MDCRLGGFQPAEAIAGELISLRAIRERVLNIGFDKRRPIFYSPDRGLHHRAGDVMRCQVDAEPSCGIECSSFRRIWGCEFIEAHPSGQQS